MSDQTRLQLLKTNKFAFGLIWAPTMLYVLLNLAMYVSGILLKPHNFWHALAVSMPLLIPFSFMFATTSILLFCKNAGLLVDKNAVYINALGLEIKRSQVRELRYGGSQSHIVVIMNDNTMNLLRWNLAFPLVVSGTNKMIINTIGIAGKRERVIELISGAIEPADASTK